MTDPVLLFGTLAVGLLLIAAGLAVLLMVVADGRREKDYRPEADPDE